MRPARPGRGPAIGRARPGKPGPGAARRCPGPRNLGRPGARRHRGRRPTGLAPARPQRGSVRPGRAAAAGRWATRRSRRDRPGLRQRHAGPGGWWRAAGAPQGAGQGSPTTVPGPPAPGPSRAGRRSGGPGRWIRAPAPTRGAGWPVARAGWRAGRRHAVAPRPAAALAIAPAPRRRRRGRGAPPGPVWCRTRPRARPKRWRPGTGVQRAVPWWVCPVGCESGIVRPAHCRCLRAGRTQTLGVTGRPGWAC